MSQGIGKIQQGVLDALTVDRLPRRLGPRVQQSYTELAQAVYGPKPTPGQVSAIRRAVRGLRALGLVETIYLAPTSGRTRTYVRAGVKVTAPIPEIYVSRYREAELDRARREHDRTGRPAAITPMS